MDLDGLCCGVSESEGTLILPRIESSQRHGEDDTTTITSDDSFFSAAEVGPPQGEHPGWALSLDVHLSPTLRLYMTLYNLLTTLLLISYYL